MRRRIPRRIAAALVVLAACGLAVLPAGPAAAHSYLLSSDPADGATLAAAPHVLHLRFSESVELAATAVDIVDGGGQHHAPLSLRIARAADETAEAATQADTELPSEIVATLPDLAPDSYRISWRTVSSDDLHATSGVLVFGIGQAITASGWHENAPGATEAALRWLLFLGIAGAAGALLLTRLIARAARAASSDRRYEALAAALRVGAAAALVALVADVALLVEQLIASGVSLRRVATGGYGQHWLLRTAGLLVVFVNLAMARRARAFAGGGRPRTAIAWLGAAVAIVGNATLGHSGASGSPTRVVADAFHVFAVAVWAGTVLTAALVCLATRRRDVITAALRRFGVPATMCVAVMVVTGVYLASDVVGSVDAALLTWYGRALLLKVALVAVALAFGGVNHRRLRREGSGSAGRRVRVAVVREAVALGLVFAAAAVLLSGQPATEPQLVSVAAAKVVPLLSERVGDVQESLAIRPNVPGRNVVLVQTLDT
ncbi:MAG: copper transport protein, partial [Frankiaceae bacterium]|nr:copper transport protein [Frankiaceae bacterium]